MANLMKVVSFIVSHPPRNKFRGSFTTHSPLLSLSKTSSFLVVGIGKRILAPFYSTLCSNRQKLFNPSRSIICEKCDDNSQKPSAAVKYTTKEIKRLCRFGKIDSAIALLEELGGIGCKPDVVTYTILIDSLFEKLGREDYALKLYREMAFHHGILPNHVTYSSLLHYLRILSRRDGISKMLKDMEDQGVYVDFRTFKIFVDAYCKEGRMDDAESVLKLMIQRGISPDEMIYRWVIQGYCLQGNMNKSRQVFDSMRCTRVPPCVHVYNSLIHGYCKDSKIEEAMHLFHEMMKSDAMELFSHVPIPNECTYKIVLEGLCNNNQVEEAVSLFHSMGLGLGLGLGDNNKLNSNSNIIRLYNVLIEGAKRSGKLGIARILYNDMTIIKGLQPNDVTYVAMIEVFCQEGLEGEAKKLLIEMKEKGIWPINVACINLLIRFLKNKQRDLVQMLLLEMEGRGFGFDASTVKIKLSDDASFLYLRREC